MILKKRVEWISNVTVYPGEDELLALAQGAIRVLNGEEKAKNILEIKIKFEIFKCDLRTFLFEKI